MSHGPNYDDRFANRTKFVFGGEAIPERTLRDDFAIAALQGILAATVHNLGTDSAPLVAPLAYVYADRMMEARK